MQNEFHSGTLIWRNYSTPSNFECLEDDGCFNLEDGRCLEGECSGLEDAVWGARELYENRAIDCLPGILTGAIHITCQSRCTTKSIWTHVQLWAAAGWTYWPQKVMFLTSIRKFSTSDPSSDLSTPVRKPHSETKRLFPGTGLPLQFLYIGESGM